MTEAEKIWTDKLLEVAKEWGGVSYGVNRKLIFSDEAACRLIEEHEAFRQEVSDAITAFRKVLERGWCTGPNTFNSHLSRFIIAKPEPDPLIEAVKEAMAANIDMGAQEYTDALRQALAKHGLKIVEVDDD